MRRRCQQSACGLIATDVTINMGPKAVKATLRDVEPLRALYLQEMRTQIRFDFADSYMEVREDRRSTSLRVRR